MPKKTITRALWNTLKIRIKWIAVRFLRCLAFTSFVSDKLLSASEDRMERVVGLAVEGDIGEIDVAESILRERLKARQIK